MNFQLRVLKGQSEPETLQLEALSENDAKQQAEQKGFTVLNVRQTGLKKSRKFPLILFCQELNELLSSGLTLYEAIETLQRKEVNSQNNIVLASLRNDLSNGLTFSQALANKPEQFPGLFVASIKACETTSNIAEGLARFSDYLHHIDRLKKRITSALIYPSIVIGFGLLVILFLLVYVIPTFSQIYESRHTDLSVAAEMLLVIGQTVENHGLLLFILAFAIVISCIFAVKQPSIRNMFINFMMTFPQIGSRVKVYHLSRFYRTFAMLIRSGIPVVNALDRVTELLGASLQSQLIIARNKISNGEPFTQAMTNAGLTTPVAEQLMRVGEKSASLDNMLERAASFHEQEMIRWIDAFSKIFEPVLMAVIGIIIGGIVLLMYLPIFELASGIQ